MSKESLESYRESFFNAAKCPFLILKADPPYFTIVDVNPAYLELTRARREELIGKSILKVFPADPASSHRDPSLLYASLQRVIESRQFHETDAGRFDIPAASGIGFERRFWRYSNTPITDPEGEMHYILHSPVDVTALYNLQRSRKAVIDAVGFRWERLFSVFMQAPVGIQILKGPEYIIELINPFLCDIYGRDEKDLLNRSVLNILKKEEQQAFKRIMDEVVASGEPYTGTEIPLSVIREGKEEEVFINLINKPYYETDNLISGIISIVTDVTAQVKLRKKLQESEQRLKLAIESSGIGIWDLDLQNNKAAAYFKSSELQASIDTTTIDSALESLLKLVMPDDKILVNQGFAKAVQTGHVNMQIRVQWPDESVHWLQLTGEAVMNAKGQPERILGTTVDITEAKENELKKDEMISVVGHELKTPVTSLNALTQVLAKKFNHLEEELAAVMLKKMTIQVSRLSVLIKDLMDVTRIEGGKLVLRKTNFRFDELIEAIVGEIQHTTTHKLIIKKNPPVNCIGDPERTAQILTNIITNSIKYSPGKDKVIISSEADDKYVTCSVQDFGIGIPKDKQQFIFDRFFRVTEEKQLQFSGLGLGLYITAELIKQFHGSIWLTSEPGKGSIFYVRIPLDIS